MRAGPHVVTVFTEVMSMAGATPTSPPLLHGLLLEVSGHEMSWGPSLACPVRPRASRDSPNRGFVRMTKECP